jgi:hypothetical protein
MYIVCTDSGDIVAFHDSKHVVKTYIKDVFEFNNIKLKYAKVPKEKVDLLDGLENLYLVRYGHTYVQSGYLLYIQIASGQETEDHIFAKDILYRLLEIKRLNKKDAHKIRKAIEVLEKLIYDDEHEIPTLDVLEAMKMHYDPYVYSNGLR